MVSQIGSSFTRAFSDFSQPRVGYVTTPEQQNQKDDKTTQVSNKIRSKITGKAIGVSAVAVGFLLLGLTKGVMPKSFSKLLDKWKIALEKKISPNQDSKNKYNYILDALNKFRGRFESINNFTTLKDVLFQRIMYGKNGQRTITRKIHEGITGFFNRISRNTVNSSYANSQKKFATLNEYLNSLNERLLKEKTDNPNLKKAINSINDKMREVNDSFENGFGINARNQRLGQMNNAYDGLFDYFWNSSLKDIRNFRSKNMWSSYIAEDYLYASKKEIVNSAKQLRRIISNNIDDDYFTSIANIKNIRKYINLKDNTSREIIQNLQDNLLKYKKITGKNADVERTKLKQEILSELKQLSTSINSEKYSPDTAKIISEQISEVENIISNSTKGKLQEILTQYKQILPESEYNQLKSKIIKAVKSLDDSIDIETNEYFDKARDLRLGSAPTDVLSILGTAGTVAWLVGKSKDKDEVVSASLKYGIPAVGAIATSLYCAARLISGGKALVFGLVSGWAINKLGEFADSTRKQYALEASIHRKNQPYKV